MGQVIVDNIDLLEPNLRIPGKKPVGQVKIDWSHPLARGLRAAILYYPDIRDLVTGQVLTKVGSPTKSTNNYTFDGTADGASLQIDLSNTRDITVAIGMDISAYNNTDDLAAEFTPNFGASNGILIDPNSGAPYTGLFQLAMNPGVVSSAGYPRPSVGYHDYCFAFINKFSGLGLIVDGKSIAASATSPLVPVANYANSTLYINCRNNASLFASSINRYLFIWDRNVWTNYGTEISRDPYQFLIPQ